jgi:hypothetical protein
MYAPDLLVGFPAVLIAACRHRIVLQIYEQTTIQVGPATPLPRFSAGPVRLLPLKAHSWPPASRGRPRSKTFLYAPCPVCSLSLYQRAAHYPI